MIFPIYFKSQYLKLFHTPLNYFIYTTLYFSRIERNLSYVRYCFVLNIPIVVPHLRYFLGRADLRN